MRQLARFILKITGWKIEGSLPELKRLILISAPHTSMWDFIWGFLFARAVGIKPNFLIKYKYFFWPLGPILRALGAYPVYPNRDTRFYKQIVEQIKNSPSFYLIITPEGTRKAVKRWKTGFYKMSIDTETPIQAGAVDYKNRKLILGPVFYPTGNQEEDMRKIQGWYRAEWAKHPEKYIEHPPAGL
ncbi:MAG: acyltransferase [Bacteroidales bacterium]|nr:acyltransferase [Bacteroidales bacterium]NPV36283.1 acyltransferase [Bacteroidales bacterium]